MSAGQPQVVKLRPPGKAKVPPPRTTKGRQVDAPALEEVRATLGERPRRRDLLIEWLHLLQDRFGYLSERHLAALALEMRLPQAEVFEVATFYAHFEVIKQNDQPPPPLTLRVCDSLSCEMLGAGRLLEELASHLGDQVRVVRAPCMGRCDAAPVAELGHYHIEQADVPSVATAVAEKRHSPVLPPYTDFSAYQAQGGYQLYEACRSGQRELEAVLRELDDAQLRGLGGAGFPTGRKWKTVRSYPGPRLMAVNADEGEPGTFKDRYYLERDPHRVLEGMLIAAWAVEADKIYVYLRDEYPALHHVLQQEIRALESASLAAAGQIELRRGAGAYICGEESSMIESIEGKRGLPRHRPPYVAERGLFDRPTLVNNVETLFWVRDIVEKGSAWFAGHGRHGGAGLRSYSVSGRVAEPGVKLAPAGITVRELIDEYCGGMLPGHSLKAYLPGGASGGILPATHADLPLEFGKLEEHGCFVGSHAVIILSHQDDIRAAALNLMRFFEDESCGQCTPCRVGTEKAVQMMRQARWDVPLLERVAAVMADASICGLGQAAANPLKCLLRYFPEEVPK